MHRNNYNLSRGDRHDHRTPDTFTSPAIDAGTGLREGYAEVGDVTLHYVEAGDGPLVVLLHGFPEFWYGWRQQIAPLVEAGFRVVAPDLRGYNLSSKPDGFADYTADKLADRHPRSHPRARCRVRDGGRPRLGRGKRRVETLAMNHPEVVDRLAILNAAHPRKLNEGLRSPRQLLRSWYFFTSSSRGCPSAVRAAGTAGSSSASCATPARRTRRRSSIATSRRGPSPGRRRR